ncbi:sulfate transporter CysZ [Isoalcanivorax beigongshangi]|uniref:Sulfate transporter CysZ n=1 Tax=Isoalcanivorax beigongshangi TaxID=3238810 RepID=A0ABV4AKJ2_9GAMM
MIAPFAEALDTLRRSAALARSRTLRSWVVVPVLVNILLFGTAYYFAATWISGLIAGYASGWAIEGTFAFLNPGLSLLSGLLQVVVWLSLLVLMATVFTAVAQLLASPFMGFLAAKVDLMHAGPLGFPPQPEESIAGMTWRTIKRELRKFWYWLWRAVLLLILVVILSFIPGLNLLGTALWFGWSAWMMAIQYIDYGADTRLVPFAEVLARLRQRRLAVLSLGGIILGLSLVPLVNLVIMPVAVIAGTLFWLERMAPRPAMASQGAVVVTPAGRHTDSSVQR